MGLWYSYIAVFDKFCHGILKLQDLPLFLTIINSLPSTLVGKIITMIDALVTGSYRDILSYMIGFAVIYYNGEIRLYFCTW